MINFYAPINYLGYGIHAYNLMKAFNDMYTKDISLIPPFGRVQWRNTLIDKWLDNQQYISSADTGIMIFNEPFLSQFSGDIRIGFPVFEMEKFTPLSIAMMKTCDWLLTPSTWGERVIERETGISEVEVVNEGYDPEIFYPEYSLDYKKYRIAKHGLTFVHVGKWEERKGTKDIFMTFINTFRDSKNKSTLTALIDNKFNPNWRDEVIKFLGHIPHEWIKEGLLTSLVFRLNKATIKILPSKHYTFQEMADLYRSADFGIWLSKAEGWNLPLMECIACGTPAITTTWTGMSEYLAEYPDELKIRYYDLEVADDGVWFHGDRGIWNKPKLLPVYTILKQIKENPVKYLELESDCLNAIKTFTWKHAATQLYKVLQKLGGIE